ncbi:hypothetical protein ABEB36_012049 [Hypothenemus hampei]|uniref:Cytochrome P450 n=1 Tax=Hypothenemus hampei TaxID=57062 RepID=A0ABD1E9V7_HYPHA
MICIEYGLVLLTIIFGYFGYLFWNVLIQRKQFEWIPSAPRLPIIGALLEFGGNSETLTDLSRLLDNDQKMTYFEIGLTRFIISQNYDFLEFVLSSNEILEKSPFYNIVRSWLATGLITSSGTKWRKHRKIITPAFHFSILERFIEIFDSNSRTLIRKLQNISLKDPIFLDPYISAMSLDIICESAMGLNTNSQNHQNQEYVNAVKNYCRIAADRVFSLWKHHDFGFKLSLDYWRARKCLQVLHSFTNNVIVTRKREFRRNDGTRKMFFLDVLLNATVDGQPLTHEEIREEVDTFMFAGHDTVSSSICFTLYLLARYPEVQELVRDEQNDIFGKNTESKTTYRDLQQMKYLEMVIKESLRLYPPVPLIGRKITKDIQYKEHCIPKGTILGLFIYGINRDPDFFEKPHEFLPERFLEQNTNAKYPFSYIPFSAGPRNCIGQKFAMLEMKCAIGKIVRNFQLISNGKERLLANELTLKFLNGLQLKLKSCT